MGLARPRPLRGACSELTLAPSDIADDGFVVLAGSLRAASEANIGDCMDGDEMDVVSTDSGSRESLPGERQRGSASGRGRAPRRSTAASKDSFGRSQSVDYAELSRLADEDCDSSMSMGSDLGSEEALSISSDFSEVSETSGLSSSVNSGDGRGRGRTRAGRGKLTVGLRSDSAEDKKLTAVAAQVTSRLYQPRSSPADRQRKFQRGKDSPASAPTSSPSPSSPKLSSPQLSSRSQSRPSPTTGRRGAHRDPADTSKRTNQRGTEVVKGARDSPEPSKRKSREEWDRPWRTRPPTLNKSSESVEDSSPVQTAKDRNRERRENRDRPWRQDRSRPDVAKDSQGSDKHGPKSPLVTRKGVGPVHSASKTVPGHRASSSPLASGRSRPEVRSRVREDTKSSDKRRTHAKVSPGHSGVSSSVKDSGLGEETNLSKHDHAKVPGEKKDSSKPTRRATASEPHLPTNDAQLSASFPPTKRQLSGSDSSLTTSRPRQQRFRNRIRSRLRQFASVSSLPIVPEAAGESDSGDTDPAPLTSDPNMAALVAAVPRRQRRGRRGMLTAEEEERRHSEPVGEKWAEALAQYTAEMEGGLAQEALHKANLQSPASSQDWTDEDGTALSMGDVPQIVLNEPLPTDVDPSLEAVPFNVTACQPNLGQEDQEEVTPRPQEETDGDQRDASQCLGSLAVLHAGQDAQEQSSGSVGSSPLVTPRAGDKRGHEEADNSTSRQEEQVPLKMKNADQNSALVPTSPNISPSASLQDVPGVAEHPELSDAGDDPVSSHSKESEGSYSADSLDECEEDPSVSSQVSQHFLDQENPLDVDEEYEYNCRLLQSASESGFRLHSDMLAHGTQTTLPSVPSSAESDGTQDAMSTSLTSGQEGSGEDTPRICQLCPDVTEDTEHPSTDAESSVESTPNIKQDVSDPSAAETQVEAAETPRGSIDDSSVREHETGDAETGELTGSTPSGGTTAPRDVHETSPSSPDQTTPSREKAAMLRGRELPVSSMEMLSLLAREEGEESSQLSDEAASLSSTLHVEQQLQAWQEVLQQLSPR